ncbi:universal stress protein [Alicyclobacillus dauci]|uniref:Universal stress protein n=1 Tax=Alicyclobacillus dauci TaxID=1475485 RepID=A0ABY6Z0N7_9BACL|nr:universal stress protein [Alicyclobacillus dauci]WAH36432.1 universal stress protein [Alicyclobacillus dauci]
MNDVHQTGINTPPADNVPKRKCGRLRLFIGAAPGVGKTYTMLREANAMLQQGIDVVIGYVESHHRPETVRQIGELQVLPRKQIEFVGRVFEEIDLDAIVTRAPEVVVVDELAHSNVPGSMHPKRYMDVEYLLNQGIHVMTAVNVQHIEGVHKEVEEVVGIRVREVIPKSFVRRADEIEVIDVTPETLRQRLRDGDIYPIGKVGQALNHFFRKSNLSALRELALREVADGVDARLQQSLDRNQVTGPFGAKETILVCANYLERSEKLVRKGHVMAERMNADLVVLTILNAPRDDLTPKAGEKVSRLVEIAHKYDAQQVLEIRNDRSIGAVIMEVAQRVNATQIVMGQPQGNLLWTMWKDNPVRYLLYNMKYLDLRIVGWKDPRGGSYPNEVKRPQSTSVRSGEESRKGRLTIYVGAAPGVGKTYTMLRDANDWADKGVDVVIGLIETHGRSETAQQVGNLEVLPKLRLFLEGRTYEELDVDRIVRRRPEVVLIDELAHTNVPGSQREKRYQDIEYLLECGIDVVTAVNIQHLESLRDKVEHITGVRVRERIPDWFMDLAREVKLIDVTPETLQQRLVDGKIYSQDKIDRALNHFFRLPNLAALREMALLEVADDVEQRLDRQQSRGKKNRARDSILVCVNYRPHSEKLIRRGWRIADRHNAQLFVLVVVGSKPMTTDEQRDLARIQSLSNQFNAVFLQKQALEQEVGQVIVDTANDLHVTQIVIGQPLSGKGWLRRWKANPVGYVLQHAEFADLHVVSNTRET